MINADMNEMIQVIQTLQRQVQELQTEVLRLQGGRGDGSAAKEQSISKRAGKISDFDGKTENFSDWAFRFRCHISGLCDKAEEILEWAAAQPHEISLEEPKQHSNPAAGEISEVIYYLVTRHAYGEALGVAKIVPRNNGAELWRKISRRYDPRTSVKRAALLNTIIQQKAVPIEELGHTLDKWMAKTKTHEDRTNTKLPDDL